MAKEYTIKVFGRKTKYRKVNGKFFRIKKDGKLAKDAATGLVLANLKNAADSRLVSSPTKTFKNIQSLAKASLSKNKKKRGQGQAQASVVKDDGGKAKLDFKKDVDKARLMIADGGKKALQKAKEKNKKVLNVTKKSENTKTDLKPLIKKKTDNKIQKKVETNKVETKKDVKPLQKIQSKNIKTTKTKALQNQPKKEDKKKNVKKPESRLDAKGNYKGTNIKPTKLQLERLKKRGLA